MLVGIGMDLVRISRVRTQFPADARGVEHNLLTPMETLGLSDHSSPAVALAARIAVKESVLKALGTGIVDVGSWREVEVLGSATHPEVRLHGRAGAAFRSLGATRVVAAVSLTREWAVAGIVLET